MIVPFAIARIAILFCSTYLFAALHPVPDETALFYKKVRTSLADSSWPSDHADTARSKFTLNAGFPRDFKSSDVKMLTQPNISEAQWLYTAGSKSEHLYTIHGKSVSGAVSKLDSQTLEVLQTFPLPPALYIGGLLMHKNGHVYCAHANRLYAFWGGDLTNSTVLTLPTQLNGNLVQTNGMLVTQDGYLVIKQWSMILEDLAMLTAAKSFVFKILIALLFITVTSIKYLYKGQSISRVKTYLVAITLSVGAWFFLLFLFVRAIQGGYDLFTFVSSNTLFHGGGGGELKILDPISLQVVASARLTERCSYGRMSMVALSSWEGQEEDAIVLVGDENLYQLRWRPSERRLFMIPRWTTEYRRWGDGTFPGTGPAIFGEVAYFTDNTFPVYLGQSTYTLFAAPLTHFGLHNDTVSPTSEHRITNKDYVPADELPLPMAPSPDPYDFANFYQRLTYRPERMPSLKERGASVSLTGHVGAKADGGFMFWSVVIDPVDRTLVVWDSSGRSVQSRHLGDLSMHWELRGVLQSDCLNVAADKGHVYMTDYSDGPKGSGALFRAATGDSHNKVDKFFVVADSATGAVLFNTTVSSGLGMQISLIANGVNNDVFLGTRGHLVRLYV